MRKTFATSFEARKGMIALALALSAALPLPGHAVELWKINFERSRFGPVSSTLFLERQTGNGTSAGAPVIRNGNARKFVVISDNKIYVATDEDSANSTPESGIKPVNYAGWKSLKLVKVGDDVRPAEFCNFSCQAGLAPKYLSLTFKNSGIDAGNEMRDVAVLSR